jgi:tRNA(fMet)-specific endonuclease VapC
MTRFLLDSNAAGDYIDRRHGVFERAALEVAKGNRIGIGVPVLGELVARIERSDSRERNMKTTGTVGNSFLMLGGE